MSVIQQTDVELLSVISTLVDECALDKPVNWELLNYEQVKEISVSNVIEIFKRFPDVGMNIELMTMMAYLLTENTHLWIEKQIQSSKETK